MNLRLETTPPEIVYPDTDGKPMAENTLQFQWIMTIQGNLDALFGDNPNVFVAGDNLIYPKEGDTSICQAPDVYVAFGRPKGHRGSYKVWTEGGIFPQVVFEVLSPNNSGIEMAKKRKFYRRYGAEEYYVYDPNVNLLEGCVREGNRFVDVNEMNGFVSPRLGIRFDTSGPELAIHYPNGERFRTFVELGQWAATEKQRAEQEKQRAEQEKARADKAEQERESLRAKLRELGVNPDTL
jgi:Uma2 family endonuclease